MSEQLELLLTSPIPNHVRKILDSAHANGWQHNFTSLVTRWAPHGENKYGLPWFASWHLNYVPARDKWSWRWAGGMAANLQRLNRVDCLLYLEHPEVIHPEPPGETQSDKINKMRGIHDGEGHGQD